MKMFLLFSHKLTEEQAKAAEKELQIKEFVYLPEDLQQKFSHVPPDLQELQDYVEPFWDWLKEQSNPKDYVLIQGDFGVVYLIVQKALQKNLIPIYSTTERISQEIQDENGNIKMTKVFRHKKFRRYGQ